MVRSVLILSMVLIALLLLPGIAAADQPVPFAPMGNVTGNYTLTQGSDTWYVNTNMPLSSGDAVYPEVLFYLMVLIGVAFLVTAVVFVSFADHVPSIGLLMAGMIIFGDELAASFMTPLVGRIDVFSQVVAGTPNLVYVNEVVVYTLSPSFAYACWGLAIAGFIVAVAGVLSFFGVFQRRGLAQAQKGNYLEQDVADAKDPEVIRWREREPRR